MTQEEKIKNLHIMLGDENIDDTVLTVYLSQANEKILNKRFPYGTELTDVEAKYEYLQLELTVCLYNQRGGEGQSSHSENGVNRSWRTESEILEEIPSMIGLPL